MTTWSPDDAGVRESAGVTGNDVVQAFARGLAVIRAFDAQHPTLTLSDVSRRAGITRAAAGRFLRTLEMLGYVRSSGRDFALTPHVLELGFSYLSALSLPEIVQPHLERLSRDLNESVSAAVLDGQDIVYVARVAVRRIMSVGITIGTRFPAASTSTGRVLLADADPNAVASLLRAAPLAALTPRTRTDAAEVQDELRRAREQGWALVDGELELGLRSIAAPIHGRDGRVLAAVNVSMSTGARTVDEIIHDVLPSLLAATLGIEADLHRL